MPARADALGSACVESGDTLHIDGRRAYGACRGGIPVRLFGITAPAVSAVCQHQGQTWPCGRKAASVLLHLTLDRTVTCLGESVDPDGYLIAVCKAGGLNLNETMVRLGFAVSAGSRYARAEGAARAAHAGLWTGTFKRPAR
nr:thermonuclease family protein [Roseospira goensis]